MEQHSQAGKGFHESQFTNHSPKTPTADRAPPRSVRRYEKSECCFSARTYPTSLVARCRLSASGFGDADVAGYFILGNGVHNQLQGAAIGALVEEDRLVHRKILLFDARIIHNQGYVIAFLVGIGAAQLDHKASDLLRFVLAVDGELNVFALTEAAKLFHIFMVARNEGSQFAARHFQIGLCAIEVRTYAVNLA